MKAIVYHQYGSAEVLKCEEIEKPIHGDDEVLIRVRAASVNPREWHFMRGAPYMIRIMTGLRRPRTTCLGTDLAGQVEAVGRNYTQEDFTQGEQRYDLIFDCVGNRSFSACRRVLRSKGTLLIVGGSSKGNWLGPLLPLLKAIVMSPFVSQTLAPFLARRSKPDLITMKALLEAGKVLPVIDRTYPLSEVPDAIRYLEEGHARGKVVIALWT